MVESKRFWKYLDMSAHKDIPFTTLLCILAPRYALLWSVSLTKLPILISNYLLVFIFPRYSGIRAHHIEVLVLDSFVDSPEVLRLLNMLPNLETLVLSGSHWRVDKTGTQSVQPSEDFILSSSQSSTGVPIPVVPLRRARGLSNSGLNATGVSRASSTPLSTSPRGHAALSASASSPRGGGHLHPHNTQHDALGLEIDTTISASNLKTLFLSSSLHQWTEEDLFTILDCTPHLRNLFIGARRSSAQADPSYAVSIDPARVLRGISLRCSELEVLDISSLHENVTEEFDFLLPKLRTVFVDDKRVYQLVKANLAKCVCSPETYVYQQLRLR
jgi:hypothetical protein